MSPMVVVRLGAPDRTGKVCWARLDYLPFVGAANHCDASGRASTFCRVLAAAPDDASYHITYAEKCIGTGEYTGETGTQYFDTNGDGTGISAAMWTVRARLLDGTTATYVLPDPALEEATAEQTISLHRADATV